MRTFSNVAERCRERERKRERERERTIQRARARERERERERERKRETEWRRTLSRQVSMLVSAAIIWRVVPFPAACKRECV